ncbi:MAG TPA: glycosyltransferase family 4 protein [Stellaceae bacterium]|nr:glycosyltransferase family 4 protein [Stellaceae bacterium]
MTGLGGRPVRIAVIASVIARYDAISMAARDTVRAFRDAGGFDVSAFTARSDFPDLGAYQVRDARALRSHRKFRAADVAIYHFGVFSPLFEALSRDNGRTRQIVAFHNVTPPEYVAPAQRAVAEQSLRQLETFRNVDRYWAVSPTNADALVARGVDRARIEVIPLAVDRPAAAALESKPVAPVRLLFVGRLVPSKGVLDLIEAIDIARTRTATAFQLDIAGNEDFSDASYAADVKAAVANRGLSTLVRFLGAVEDARLDELYRRAHLLVIPSYHEGFCRPVIEGLRAGCVPVGYAAYNLPRAAHGLGRMVPTGDRGALAAALVELIAALAPASGRAEARLLPLDTGPLSPATFDAAARRYVQDFTFERVAGQMVLGVQGLLSR